MDIIIKKIIFNQQKDKPGRHMFAYDYKLEPDTDYWKDYKKEEFIHDMIMDVCKSIVERGIKTPYSDVYDKLYEYIEDQFHWFLEVKYGDD